MIQSVQRAAQILGVLGSGTPRLGVTEIAERVGLAKPTVHGLLRTLEADDLVAQDPETGKYSLGPGVLQLGNAYLDGSELHQLAAEEVFQAARRRDDELSAPADVLELRPFGQAANDECAADAGLGAHLVKCVDHLAGQFPSGDQHDSLYGLGSRLLQTFQDRQQKGERLASPGLGGGEHVPA